MGVGGDGTERFDDSGRVLGGQPFEIACCRTGDDEFLEVAEALLRFTFSRQ
jgi:hypothetical protein